MKRVETEADREIRERVSAYVAKLGVRGTARLLDISAPTVMRINKGHLVNKAIGEYLLAMLDAADIATPEAQPVSD